MMGTVELVQEIEVVPAGNRCSSCGDLEGLGVGFPTILSS